MKKYFFLLCIFLLLSSCKTDSDQSKVTAIITKTTIDTTGSYTGFLNHLHKKRTLKTYDQSLQDYLESKPLRPDSTHTTIYLLPIGNIDTTFINLLDNERDYLQRFFQLDVKLLPAASMNDLKKISQVKTRFHSTTHIYGKGAEEAKKEQIEANSLVKHYIKPNKPNDAVVVLGITDHDIYIDKYNYIFGTSDLHNGLGIISVYRLLSKESIRNVAAKQITNLFSIPNTKDYDCLLNFHNSIEEQEMGVSYLSPLALQKLNIAIDFDHKNRLEELEQFWKKERNFEYQKYYASCLLAYTKFRNQKQ